MRVLLALTIAVVVASCGDGNSNPSDIDGPVVDGLSNPPDGDNEKPNPVIITPISADNPGFAVRTPRLLMASNGPAPGIAGARINSLTSHSLADNGWVAIAASYDVGNRDQHGIWRGQNGALQQVAFTGTAINGYANDVWFESAVEVHILSDSTVWALVELGGRGSRSRDTAVVEITADGTINGVLRTGDVFLPSRSDSTVRRFNFLAVGGGDAYVSLVGNTGADDFVIHLSTQTPTMVTTDDRFNGKADSYPIVLDDCVVRGIDIDDDVNVHVNRDGSTAFTADLGTGLSRDNDCPEKGIVRYKDGQHFVHLTTDDALPLFDGTRIEDVSLVGLNDDNTTYTYIKMETPQGSQTARNSAIWTSSLGNASQLVALEGETIPPGFDTTISDRALRHSRNSSEQRLAMSVNQRMALINPNDQSAALLSGTAYSELPYESVALPGATQLSRITGTNEEQVPNAGETSYFEQIGSVKMNNLNQVWFLARAVVPDGSAESFTGLWRSDSNALPMLEVSLADEIPLNGNTDTLRSIERYTVNNNSDVLLSGTASSGARAEYLIMISSTPAF